MLSSLAADRVRVAVLDAEILVLERGLSKLRLQRAQVQDKLVSYKYPVLTLPNEIVAEIFIHFLPDYPHCPPLTGLESPLVLTQICREWRAIALETPALWQAMSLVPDSSIKFEHQAHLCRLWLERSRSCPLSIVFNEWSSSRLYASETPPQALHIVIPHLARCETLVLSLSILPPLDIPMPLLRRLELSLVGRGSDPASTPRAAFTDAPLLRTVLINPGAARLITLPWAQLTSLALRPEVLLRDCVPILQAAANLLHCNLGLIRRFGDENLPRIVLPVLQSLTLTHLNDDNPVTTYLETFHVPALRRLRVAESLLGSNAIDLIASLILRTGCQLQELCVTGARNVADSSYREAFPSTNVSFELWSILLSEF
ncbi:hypothetical protein C8R45DRAFT_912960 [Mycena sanguinolenta]|nr:hypothetical protein C8R45DRAFT_912960 [Mycena sanguinolenta]